MSGEREMSCTSISVLIKKLRGHNPLDRSPRSPKIAHSWLSSGARVSASFKFSVGRIISWRYLQKWEGYLYIKDSNKNDGTSLRGRQMFRLELAVLLRNEVSG